VLEITLPGRASRAEELYAYLREVILSGSLPPGARLVEEMLARGAGVSRTPVREALHRLEADGLVQNTSHGVVVTAYTDEELYDLCVAREGMEGLAARLAATTRSDLDLASFERIMDASRDATQAGDVARIVELNHAFHEAVWRAARNRYLTNELRLLRGLIERLQPTTLSGRERQIQALDEHSKMVDALTRGDSAAAEAICRHHFQVAMAIRLSKLSPRAGGS
jgi:DNA-binding GntR family transcriptional regulator